MTIFGHKMSVGVKYGHTLCHITIICISLEVGYAGH